VPAVSGDFDDATGDPSGRENDDLTGRDQDDNLIAPDHDDTVNARAQLARRRSESAVLPPREGVYIPPDVGPSDLSNLPGPFTPRQLARIDEALSLATEETGLLFSLYVGELAEPTRPAAEKLAAQLPAAPTDGAVLVAVSPGQRVLHIITTEAAVKRLPNRVCALAALGMRAAFVGGDLTAGAVNGLRMLADAAGQQSSAHAPSPAPLA
jgi:hypothetical protein